MAEAPDIVGLDPADAPDFGSLMRDYRASRVTNPTSGSKWPTWRNGGEPKTFARPVTSDTNAAPLTHPKGSLAWFQPEHAPWHPDKAGQPKGDPVKMWPLAECPAGSLCIGESFDRGWGVSPVCDGGSA